MDEFRGTASAHELVRAVARVAREMGIVMDGQPMSDGGEGFVDAFAGAVTLVEVPGPWGDVVSARITRHRSADAWIAVVQAADVVGRPLVPPTSDEALAATSVGLGQLIVAASELDVEAVLVGCGDTATSDGGRVLPSTARRGHWFRSTHRGDGRPRALRGCPLMVGVRDDFASA